MRPDRILRRLHVAALTIFIHIEAPRIVVHPLGLANPVTQEFPTLSGMWFQRRTVLGRELLEKRYFDVLPVDMTGEVKRYSAFALTGCKEVDFLPDHGFGGSTRCDEEISLTLQWSETSAANESFVVSKSSHGNHESVVGYVVLSESGEPQELRWDNGNRSQENPKTWVVAANYQLEDSPSFFGAPEGFDDECTMLSGPAGGEPIAFSVTIQNSFALHIHNLPGISVESIGCVTNVWLANNQERFECILRKAVEAQKSRKNWNLNALEEALVKLRKALPADKNASCIPTVCIVMSFPIFPIISPVPSLTLLTAFPRHFKTCNGLGLKEEVEQMELAALASDVAEEHPEVSISSVVEKVEHSSFVRGMGLAFTFFPIPGVAHWHNLQFTNSLHFDRNLIEVNSLLTGPGLEHGANNTFMLDESKCDELRSKFEKADALLLDAMKVALDKCPSVLRRLNLHAGDTALNNTFRETQSSQRKFITRVASLMPELGAKQTSWKGKLDFSVGIYGQIGTGGVSCGWYGGVAWTERELGQKYKGCNSWKKVIRLWYSNPRKAMMNQDATEILLQCDTKNARGNSRSSRPKVPLRQKQKKRRDGQRTPLKA